MSMKKENSYGIIPVRFQENAWQVLLVQHHAGHWGFPKGHAELNETPQQSAERELQEETKLTVQRYLSLEPFIENYIFNFHKQRISKNVQYFLALVQGEVAIQECEIQASRWLSLLEAHQVIFFKEGKRICQEVEEYLKTMHLS